MSFDFDIFNEFFWKKSFFENWKELIKKSKKDLTFEEIQKIETYMLKDNIQNVLEKIIIYKSTNNLDVQTINNSSEVSQNQTVTPGVNVLT